MKTNQCALVLQHLAERGSITPLEAMQDYGIMRLAARIADLRKLGYRISSEAETANNRFGEAVRYARYTLTEGAKNSDILYCSSVQRQGQPCNDIRADKA